MNIGEYTMMKRLSLIVLVMMMPCVASAAGNGHYSVVRSYNGVKSINYDGVSESKQWYMSARADLSFLSWKNKYTQGTRQGSDSISLKAVFGGDIAIGSKLNDVLRADLELGYVGNYSTQEKENFGDDIEVTDFDLSVFYTTLNGYYDFNGGVYMGLGAGLAFVETSLNYSKLYKASKSNVSPMGAVMLGWAHQLNDNVYLDMRYRFSAFSGSTLDAFGLVKTKIGLITDNTVSLGLRYAF